MAIGTEPNVPENIKKKLSLDISSYSSNSGFKTTRYDVLERLCSQKPVSLYEIDRVRYRLSYYLGQATQIQNKDEAYKATIVSILNCLERNSADLVTIPDRTLVHDRIIAAQDPFLLQQRITIISTIVAVFSALASIIAAVISFVQLFHSHGG